MGHPDQVTTDELVNYFILQHQAQFKQTPQAAAQLVRQACTDQGIQLAPATILKHWRDLRQGRRPLRLPTVLKGRVAAKRGKEKAYAAFWRMVELFLPEPRTRQYCGLAALQIADVLEHIGGRVQVIEKDLSTHQSQQQLLELLPAHQRRRVQLQQHDLFRLPRQPRFNVLDLDLMCSIPRPRSALLGWAQQIEGLAALDGPILVNLTTAIGHGLTKKAYLQAMPKELFKHLESVGLQVQTHFSFGYRDRAIPMRCEHFTMIRRSPKTV